MGYLSNSNSLVIPVYAGMTRKNLSLLTTFKSYNAIPTQSLSNEVYDKTRLHFVTCYKANEKDAPAALLTLNAFQK